MTLFPPPGKKRFFLCRTHLLPMMNATFKPSRQKINAKWRFANTMDGKKRQVNLTWMFLKAKALSFQGREP